jgi:nucleoside diphosphate kinase
MSWHDQNHPVACKGEIIGRFERKGFKLKGLKMYQTPKSVAEEHYKDLASKPFYKDLVRMSQDTQVERSQQSTFHAAVAFAARKA